MREPNRPRWVRSHPSPSPGERCERGSARTHHHVWARTTDHKSPANTWRPSCHERGVRIAIAEATPLERAVNDVDSDLRRAILGYLAENPGAMDTLEGIAHWWVPRQRIAINVAACARALDQLVERGEVEELGPSERKRYRLRSSEPSTP